jgi:hypothetical protein
MAKRNVTCNGNGGATQLSLFDFPVEEKEPSSPQEEQETVIDPYGNTLPAVVYESTAWADGDTSPLALARLAETILGDVTTCYYGPPPDTIPEKHRWKREYGHFIPGFERYYYRCVSSGIVEGKVWGAYVYESCLMDKLRRRAGDEEEDL